MRTTLDLDEDVLHAVKQRAREERRSAGQVLSQLAREALTARAPASTESFYGFRPLPRRPGGPVTNDMVDELREAEGV